MMGSFRILQLDLLLDNRGLAIKIDTYPHNVLTVRLEKEYNDLMDKIVSIAMDNVVNIVLLVVGAALFFAVFWLHRRYTRSGPP